MRSVNRLLWCYHETSILFRLSTRSLHFQVLGPTTRTSSAAKTMLEYTTQHRFFNGYSTVPSLHRDNIALSNRGFSSSTFVRGDAIGNIKSTHYHLIYTCKVTLIGCVAISDGLISVLHGPNVSYVLYCCSAHHFLGLEIHVENDFTRPKRNLAYLSVCRFAPPGP